MTKLTQAQRLVLFSACEHELGLATRSANLKPAQATRMAAFFAESGLAKEIRAKATGPVWREDEQGRSLALKILKAGRELIEVSDLADADTTKGGAGGSTSQDEDRPVSTSMRVAGSKSQLIVGLMQRPDGASIADLIAATGWLPHTTRAALTGLRKKGIAIERRPAAEGQGSVYRIVAGTSRQAA